MIRGNGCDARVTPRSPARVVGEVIMIIEIMIIVMIVVIIIMNVKWFIE